MFSVRSPSIKSAYSSGTKSSGSREAEETVRISPDLISKTIKQTVEDTLNYEDKDIVNKFKFEQSLKDYIDPILEKLDSIKQTVEDTPFPTIDKNNAFSFEGGGTMSITNFMGSFLCILKQSNSTPEDILTKIDSIGGNSGGSWFLSIITAYREANEERNTLEPESETIDGIAVPLDNVKDMNQSDVLTFYDKFWLNVVRKHLFNNKIRYEDTETDSDGIAIEPVDIRKESEILFDELLSKQDAPSDEIYTLIIKEILNLEDDISLNEFEKVINIFGKHGIIKNIIEILKYVLYFLESAVGKSWNYSVQDFFLYPISKTLRETFFSDIQLLKNISSGEKPFTYTMMGSCMYDSFLRYGFPGKAILGSLNRYPSFTKPLQYLTQDMIRYEWDNPFRVIKDSVSDEDSAVVGGVMNQVYTYSGNDEEQTNLDLMDVFNFPQGDETNEIKYGKGKGLNTVTSSLEDHKVQFQNKICRDVCKYRSIADSATISSAALGISNSKTILEEIPLQIFEHIFSLFDRREDVYKRNPFGVIAENLGGDDGKEQFLLKIIGAITVGLISRLVVSNKTVIVDNNHSTTEEEKGGVSGKYFRSLITPDETTNGALIKQGILTNVDEFAQDAQDKSESGWNGIVAPYVYNSWDRSNDSDDSDKRFIFCAADGAPTINNTGLLPIIKSMQQNWPSNEVKELVYFSNDNVSVGTCDSFIGPGKAMGADLLELFGLNLNPKNYITDGGDNGNGIYKRSSLFGINLPFNTSVKTASTWIFGNQTASIQERYDYLSDKLVKSWPDNGMYVTYKDALTDIEWENLSQNPNIRADLKPGLLESYKEAMFKRFDSISTGVRLARFENVDIRRNDAMGVQSKQKCVNLTIVGTFSSIWIVPLPQVGTRQFSTEFWTTMKLYLQSTSLDKNKNLGTTGWVNKLFHAGK